MQTLAVSAGPDAVSGMLWVAAILVVVGLLVLLVSRWARRSDSRKSDGGP